MNSDQSKPVYRRRNVYIDKEFQTVFILKFCGLVAVGAGLTVVLLYLFSQQSTSVSFVHARVKVMTTADYLLPFLFQTVLVVMAFVSLASIAVTLLVSHKIAGPLFRFKQTFKDLAGGNFGHQVRLRKGDQLVEVAEDFNDMITVVRIQLIEAKIAAARIKTDLETEGCCPADEAGRKACEDLRSKVKELEKALDFFKT